MQLQNFLYPALLAILLPGGAVEAARRPANSVLLSDVKALTLRQGLKTTARRVAPIPQLKCVGGDAKGLYEIEVMRCKNAGSDYDDNNIQWTCTASLPEEFKLGSTDVICEGYDSPNDPYILKGSCGVEYRLALTSKGLEKYGKRRGGWWDDNEDIPYGKDLASPIIAGIFWLLFVGVLVYMIFKACIVGAGRARDPSTWTGPRGGGPGGGGGGGGGGYYGGDDNDPPPPYTPRSYGSYTRPKTTSGYGTNEPWRPGFWSGALGGAAAGYMAGRTGNRNNTTNAGPSRAAAGNSWWNNAGEGSSRSPSNSSPPTPSSTRHESTGFGSTRRR